MSTDNKRITVLVMDHNPILLGGIQSLISNDASLRLVGAAENAAEVWTLFLGESPRIVLVDLDLPYSSALQLIRNMKSTRSQTSIIAMATYEFDPIGSIALADGAEAIVSKARISQDLIPAIRKICGSGAAPETPDDRETQE